MEGRGGGGCIAQGNCIVTYQNRTWTLIVKQCLVYVATTFGYLIASGDNYT